MKNVPKSRILILVAISVLLIVFYINYNLQYQLQNPCNVNFGGTACYDSEGTLIGVTLDAKGEEIATGLAQNAVACSTTLTAEPSLARNEAIIRVVVPVSVSRVAPSYTSSSVRDLHCGENFTVLAKTDDDQDLWFLIELNDTERAWISAQDIILNATSIHIPTTPSAS